MRPQIISPAALYELDVHDSLRRDFTVLGMYLNVGVVASSLHNNVHMN